MNRHPKRPVRPIDQCYLRLHHDQSYKRNRGDRELARVTDEREENCRKLDKKDSGSSAGLHISRLDKNMLVFTFRKLQSTSL